MFPYNFSKSSHETVNIFLLALRMHDSIIEGSWLLSGVFVFCGEVENNVNVMNEVIVVDHCVVSGLSVVGLKDSKGFLREGNSKILLIFT